MTKPRICSEICGYKLGYPPNQNDKKKIRQFIEDLSAQLNVNLNLQSKKSLWRAAIYYEKGYLDRALGYLKILCECDDRLKNPPEIPPDIQNQEAEIDWEDEDDMKNRITKCIGIYLQIPIGSASPNENQTG